MTALDITTMLVRGVHVAALLSAFGTLTFIAVMSKILHSPCLRGNLHRLTQASAVCSLVAGLVWLTLEAAVIADADSITTVLRALPVVALRTQYGQWFVLRCLLLLVLLVMPVSRRAGLAAGLALAGIALAVQPLLGHAGAIGGGLIASEDLHLLAAGAWLGGLLPLFFAVGILPSEVAADTCRGFTPIGLSAVLLLAGTAVSQLATLMGGLPGLFGTQYGHVALVKLSLFVVLLTLAALNRLILTERMAQERSRSLMRLSIAGEMLLGALVIICAAFLASLTPGTHEQPVWPFAWRPSLAAFGEPLLRPELFGGLIAVAGGVALAVIGTVWRRVRWAALAAAVVTLFFALPHFDLLFVEAYPTSFFTSPTEFAATAIMRGARLFAANCTSCHGSEGHGDGPAAKSLSVPAADLTAEHFWAHSDGDLYWFVSHGFKAPNGSIAMPGFGSSLSSEAIWNLIDYLRAHNAGESLRRTGVWSHPLPVPQFDAACPGGKSVDLDDLRGRVLRVIAVAGDAAGAEVASPPDLTTIVMTRQPSAKPNPWMCVSREPETWAAFAILLDVTPDALAGSQILADPDAWLRAVWRPSDPGDWNDPRQLATAVQGITAHPLAGGTAAAAHVHQH